MKKITLYGLKILGYLKTMNFNMDFTKNLDEYGADYTSVNIV